MRIEPDGFEVRLRCFDQFGIKRVADIGDQHGHDIGAAGAQTLCLWIGRIAQFVHRLKYAGAQVFRDAVSMIQHMRNGGSRYPGTFSNFGDRRHIRIAII